MKKYFIIALLLSCSLNAMSSDEKDDIASNEVIIKYFGQEVCREAEEIRPFIKQVIKEIRSSQQSESVQSFLNRLDNGLLSIHSSIDLDFLGGIVRKSIDKWVKE